MFKRLLTAWKLPASDKLLCCKASYQLLKARWRMARPFKKMCQRLGHAHSEGLRHTQPQQRQQAEQIGRCVRLMSRYVPWQSRCLVQALAAQQLLQQAQIESTLYLGVNKSGQTLKAHAWLRVGDAYITGNRERLAFTAVQSFYRPCPQTK